MTRQLSVEVGRDLGIVLPISKTTKGNHQMKKPNSSTALAWSRDAVARARNGLPAISASHRAAVDAADLYPEVVKAARLVEVEACEIGRICTSIHTDVDEAGVATTRTCTTVLSRYNEGPQCHSCDRSNPASVDALIG